MSTNRVDKHIDGLRDLCWRLIGRLREQSHRGGRDEHHDQHEQGADSRPRPRPPIPSNIRVNGSGPVEWFPRRAGAFRDLVRAL
jgi:hypothetical protein